MVVRRTLWLTFTGIVVGLGAAIGLTRVLRSLLFEVSPNDPLLLGVLSVLVMAIALIASLAPAWKAATVDPMVMLRAEG